MPTAKLDGQATFKVVGHLVRMTMPTPMPMKRNHQSTFALVNNRVRIVNPTAIKHDPKVIANPMATTKHPATKPMVVASKPMAPTKKPATKPMVVIAKPTATTKKPATKPMVVASKPTVTIKKRAKTPATQPMRVATMPMKTTHVTCKITEMLKNGVRRCVTAWEWELYNTRRTRWHAAPNVNAMKRKRAGA